MLCCTAPTWAYEAAHEDATAELIAKAGSTVDFVGNSADSSVSISAGNSADSSVSISAGDSADNSASTSAGGSSGSSAGSLNKQQQLAQIIRHEDERIMDARLSDMLSSLDAQIKERSILAIGRIGDPSGVVPLLKLLSSSQDPRIQAQIAFALGEIEDETAVPALLDLISKKQSSIETRARAIEALGKIASNKVTAKRMGKDSVNRVATVIASCLPKYEEAPSANSSTQTSEGQENAQSLALTALLRLKDANTYDAIIEQLKSPNATIRWEAANVIARLKDGVAGAAPQLRPLLHSKEALDRMYAARALGVIKDRQSEARLAELLNDEDEIVVSSAITALGAIGDNAAEAALLKLGAELLGSYRKFDRKINGVPTAQNQILLLVTALGEIGKASGSKNSLAFIQEFRSASAAFGANQETEIAVARFGENAFLQKPISVDKQMQDWKTVSAQAQGLGELKGERAQVIVQDLLAKHQDPRAISDLLNAAAATKVPNLTRLLIKHLQEDDVIVRATAATLLGEDGKNTNEVIDALKAALIKARSDKMNDARIAIIEAASKLDHPLNKLVLNDATRDSDYIVRRRAIELAHEKNEELSPSESRLGPVTTGHDEAYWNRMAKYELEKTNPRAIIHTKKGDIKLELFAKESPMMVANFIDLSKAGFYNGLTFMRVVPNFVVQGGDPRGMSRV
jgi:HEAT repeat protein